MDARRVESTELELRDLKLRGFEGIALAAAALAGACGASVVLPALALPLLIGGIGVGFLGASVLIRRHLLLEDLAGDRDAYAIAEVRALALRAATSAHRHALAQSLRRALDGTSYGVAARVEANRALLEELVAALEDDKLALDPARAVALDRLLTDGTSALYGSIVPADELRSRLTQVLNGFDERWAV